MWGRKKTVNDNLKYNTNQANDPQQSLQVSAITVNPAITDTNANSINNVQQQVNSTVNTTQIHRSPQEVVHFYKKLLHLFTVSSIIKITTFLLLFCASIASVLVIWLMQFNWWWCTISAAVFIFSGIGLIWSSIYYNSVSRDLHIVISEKKVYTINVGITKMYIKASIASVNIHWICFTIYILSGLVILFAFLATWVVNSVSQHNFVKFGQWIIMETNLAYNKNPMIVILSFIAVIFLTFFLHIFLTFVFRTRILHFDEFYGMQIVSAKDIAEIKAKINKRNRWIFFAVVLTLAFIFYLIYRFGFKRRIVVAK